MGERVTLEQALHAGRQFEAMVRQLEKHKLQRALSHPNYKQRLFQLIDELGNDARPAPKEKLHEKPPVRILQEVTSVEIAPFAITPCEIGEMYNDNANWIALIGPQMQKVLTGFRSQNVTLPSTKVRLHKVLTYSKDMAIYNALGNRAATSIVNFLAMLKRQRTGSPGALQGNGFANLAYCLEASGNLFTAQAYWTEISYGYNRGGAWYLEALPFDSGGRSEGSLVISY